MLVTSRTVSHCVQGEFQDEVYTRRLGSVFEDCQERPVCYNRRMKVIPPPEFEIITSQMPKVPVEIIGSLAQDVVMRTASFPEIAHQYNMTVVQLTHAVKHHQSLRDTMVILYKEMKNNPLGSSYNMRVRAITEAMMPEALGIVQSATAKESDKARLISTFMTSVNNAEKNRITSEGGGNVGAVVQVFQTSGGQVRGINPVVIDQ